MTVLTKILDNPTNIKTVTEIGNWAKIITKTEVTGWIPGFVFEELIRFTLLNYPNTDFSKDFWVGDIHVLRQMPNGARSFRYEKIENKGLTENGKLRLIELSNKLNTAEGEDKEDIIYRIETLIK
jgi:hypothetical protein